LNDSPATVNVVMPKLGLTMTEATLVAWHVIDGDEVTKGEPLFTLETEKTSLEIEATVSGTLSITTPEGETVPVQHVIGTITPHGNDALPTPHAPYADALLQATPKARQLARVRGVSLAGRTGSGPRKMVVAADVEAMDTLAPAPVTVPAPHTVSPVARRLAEQRGVDLAAVQGTGPRGRIVRADVEAAAASQALSEDHSETSVPLAGLRAVIAERLEASWRERPQVAIVSEVDATALVSAREQLNAELDVKVSYNAFLAAAVARALVEHPQLNVHLTETGLHHLTSVDIGIAVDTPRGLLVPIVRRADRLGLPAIHAEITDLAQRAIAGTLLPSELEGGSFTITNLGMYEIELFTPIINPPQSAILGVGSIVQKPVVIDGAVEIRDRMTLSLVFDHRVVDGAPAARFLQRIKRLIERPMVLALPAGTERN